MSGYTTIEDNRIKHLEMIQAVIGRLGNDSFLVKGWAITVAGAFFGFAVNSDQAYLALVSVVPTVFFWNLDAYYLWAERLFRILYDDVRTSATVTPFFMAATSDDFVKAARQRKTNIPTRWEIFRSTTIWRFYTAIVAAGGTLAATICLS